MLVTGFSDQQTTLLNINQLMLIKYGENYEHDIMSFMLLSPRRIELLGWNNATLHW